MKWIKLDMVGSTNAYLAELIKAGEGRTDLIVTADYQEVGRGQGAHSWESQRGKNLLLSLLLHPAFLSASDQFQLSMLISLAICDILESFGVLAVIKWPNDVLVSRGKIAGILIEHGISGKNITHSIIGIGMNLNQTSFPDYPVRATSLKLESGKTVDPAHVAESLVERILCRYQILKEGNGEVLQREYRIRLFMIDQPSTFIARGRQITGIMRGVNSFGELLVEIAGEIQNYGHQEIELEKHE